MKFYSTLILACITSLCISQEKLVEVNVSEIANNIDTYAQSDDYNKVIEEIDRINVNDSTYLNLQLTKSYYLIQLEKYEESLALLNTNLNKVKYNQLKQGFVKNKALILSKLNRNKEAISLIKETIRDFPASSGLYVSLGNQYEFNQDYERAATAYMKAMELAPYKAGPHFRLGKLYYEQGNTAQAILCLNMYLLLDPDGSASFSVLKAANEMATKEFDNLRDKQNFTPDDQAFSDLDAIVNAQVAISEDFEIPNDINLALTKQTYAILSKLESLRLQGGFWEKNYIPFFKWILSSDNFDIFTYTTTYSIENEKFKKIVLKKEEDIISFLPEAYRKWMSFIGSDIIEEIAGKPTVVEYEYTEGTISGYGSMENELAVGTWTYYYPTGKLSAQGDFNKKGEKNGEWIWYHPNGTIKERGTYTDGKLQGANLLYFDNGKLADKSLYVDDNLHGDAFIYQRDGGLIKKFHYMEGKPDGNFKHYYPASDTLIQYTYTYSNGEINGLLKEFYPDGTLKSEVNYVDGKQDGVETQYHENGKKSGTYTFSKGVYNGPIKTYNALGTLNSEGVAKDGSYDGERKIYYDNGVLSELLYYEDAVLSKMYRSYDTDGILSNTFLYRKGDIKEFVYYDKEGNILSSGEKKKGNLNFEAYTPDGHLSSKGIYNVKGGKNGSWIFYDSSGIKSELSFYDDNRIVNTQITYHKNETENLKRTYVNDSIQGYSVQKYNNGVLQSQGYYIDDKAQGYWEYYHEDGTVLSKNFFHKSQLHGEQKYFSADGILVNRSFYLYNTPVSEVYYGPDGQVIQTVYYDSISNGSFTLKYPNGKKQMVSQYANGKLHGSRKSYYPDGTQHYEEIYINGENNGKWNYYYPNGQLRFTLSYKNSYANGPGKRYYEDGTLMETFTYLLGELDGLNVDYYPNGNISTETQYLNGKLNGQKKQYSPDGTLELIRYYENDKIVGYSYLDASNTLVPMIPIVRETAVVRTFFPNGKVSRSMEYDKGRLIGDYRVFYPNGAKRMVTQYVQGAIEGNSDDFYPDGTLEKRALYKTDVINGDYIKNYKNGKVKSKVSYKNGDRVGKGYYYKENGDIDRIETYFNDTIIEIEK